MLAVIGVLAVVQDANYWVAGGCAVLIFIVGLGLGDPEPSAREIAEAMREQGLAQPPPYDKPGFHDTP